MAHFMVHILAQVMVQVIFTSVFSMSCHNTTDKITDLGYVQLFGVIH
ncbi:hypothetical protein Cylst_6651 (plasmid) [Cylindrospermum stagnale PCC 7417]|uniref:Uncharacterized protein n=1 Tax=Cylindrospermum stagnale PCC 7417 TaxID=56107 RepID=K9X709_9NOST|nr:hypothetical protein Cylst_6651 [Cylindrospermum stagnale PCC 7417]